MAYNDFDISLISDEICEIYPNKEKLYAGRKAIKILLRTNPSIKYQKFLDVFKIYQLETIGEDPQFIYQLNNFINNDHWKDIYESHESLEEYRKRLQEKDEWCHEVINAWNLACQSKIHWISVAFASPKIPFAKKAYADAIFREHWRFALSSAERVFEKPFPESDLRSRILPTFRWFTALGDKHTVAKLMEGEFGKPLSKGGAFLYPQYEIHQPTEEEKGQLKKDFEEVFGKSIDIK